MKAGVWGIHITSHQKTSTGQCCCCQPVANPECSFDILAIAFLHSQLSSSLLGGSHATPHQGTGAIRAPEGLTCGACVGMLCFPSFSHNSSCREKAAGLLPALPARGVPPCPGCDGAIPLLPSCLHKEYVWCIGAVRACPIQTKHSRDLQQVSPGERDASSGRPAWQGPGGFCF